MTNTAIPPYTLLDVFFLLRCGTKVKHGDSALEGAILLGILKDLLEAQLSFRLQVFLPAGIFAEIEAVQKLHIWTTKNKHANSAL